jgi:hypothetical protein
MSKAWATQVASKQRRRGYFPLRSLPAYCLVSKETYIYLSTATANNKLAFSSNPLPVPKLQKHLESYLADCYDAIAVFLCIHIVLRFRNIAAKRDVPALDRSLSSGP